MKATERDRANALRLLPFGVISDGGDEFRNVVAEALADERERARASFLALAERVGVLAEFEQEAGRDAVALFQVRDHIRALARAEP